jgi:uncharacterized protein (TIGR03435 family)
MTKALRAVVPVVFASCAMFGQTAPNAPAFEVASIKPAAPQERGKFMVSMGGDPGRINYTNVGLKDVLAQAYSVKRHQISGPAWLDAERFDIIAKVPDGTPKEQIPAMLQNLLADRFKMSVHRETKEQPVYALVTGKNGPKLKKAEESGGAPEAAVPYGAPPSHGPGGALLPRKGTMMMNSNGHLEAKGITLAQFSDMLSNLLDRPVVDMTGMQGDYDIALDISPEELVGMKRAFAAGRGPGGPGSGGPGPDGHVTAGQGPVGPGPAGPGAAGPGGRGPGDSGPAPESAPSASIFTAVQQLGLKLESRKAPVEYIVVDKAEKVPTEN